MKRKTKKFILITVAVAVVILGPIGYLGARYGSQRRLLGWRDAGIAASQGGHHHQAADLLARYLHRRPWDVGALAAYVKSREAAELPNGQHLAETIGALKLLLSEAPERLDDRRHLLDLYARLERRPEALDVANGILAKHPHDVRTLELKTDILTKMRRDREALDVAQVWRDAVPDADQLKPQVAYVALRARLGHVPDAIVADARELLDAHKNDPRFELLLGFAYGQTGDDAQAAQWLKSAAKHPELNDEFVKALVAQFDSMGLADDSLAILQDRVRRGAGAAMRHALARRLWEMARWEQTGELLADFDPAAPQSDATLVAFKAMALANAGKAAEADAARGALAARDGQATARAWTLLLRRIVDAAAVDDKKIISECASALLADPENPYLLYYLADAQARLGELDLAVGAWQRVVAQNLSWNVPAVRLVEALLEKGQPEQAMWVASTAARRRPNDAAAVITLARAWAVGVETGSVAQADELLKLVTQVRSHLPGEDQTLLIHLQLLAQRGRKAEATKEAKAAIARPEATERLLLAVAATSRRFGLGVEAECFSTSERSHGQTAALAYGRAVDKFASGRADAGLKLFDEVVRRSAKPVDSRWLMARARYLDLIGHVSARDAWVALGDAYPEDMAVQQAVAEARAVRGEWDFTQRTIDRIKQMTGPDGLGWRLAQARLFVESSRDEADVERGSLLLNEILREYPQLPEPHVLLARALVQMKRLDGAVEQLALAARLDPTSVPIALQLAALLQSRGDFDRVRQELDRVAPQLHTAADRRHAATLLDRQGDLGEAAKLLEQSRTVGVASGAGSTDEAGQDDLFLAVLYRKQNQPDKAEVAVRKLLDRPEPGLATVQFAASLFAARGRHDEAEAVLTRLDGMNLEPGIKDLAWGSYLAETGDLATAVERCGAATKLAPSNPTAWRALMLVQMAQGRGEEWAATLDGAIQALPEDAALAGINARRAELRQACDDPAFRQLAVYFMRDPVAGAPAIELLGVMLEGRNSDDRERLASRLQQLRERHPHVLPIHLQLVQTYWTMGRGGEAVAAAQQAMNSFPADPAPAKLAVQLYAAAGRPKDMLAAADAWRARSAESPRDADLAAAQARLRLGEFEAASGVLEPYIAHATAAPDRYAEVLTTYGIALANGGRAQEAADLLWPLTSGGAGWRTRWVLVALGMRDGQTAVGWLDRVARNVPPAAFDERVVLAEGYELLGGAQRLNDPKVAVKSSELFGQVVADGEAPAAAITAAAGHAERCGDLAVAEALYRRALSLDPSLHVAHNNLAMLIARNGGNPAEAALVASKAVALQPGVATIRDTLAQAQAKAGDPRGAARSMESAVKLEPDNTRWRVRLARYLLDAGDLVEAAKVVATIEERRLETRGLPPNIQQQLDGIRKEVRRGNPG
jgi:tetratricopeptide (TPR) repeat protein